MATVSTVDKSSLAKLQRLLPGTQDSAIKGRVIAPQDPDFDRARTLFYGGLDRRPAVIIRPVDAQDVSQVVLLESMRTSSPKKARTTFGRLTRATPGTGWSKSSSATTRTTCSAIMPTSPRAAHLRPDRTGGNT